MIKKLSIIFVLFTLFGNVSSAQTIQESLLGNSASISLTPTNPQPGQEVTATLEDYSRDYFGAEIFWKINGQALPDQNNLRSITFNAGPSNSQQTIEVTLVKTDNQQVILNKVIKPLYLDLVLEPQTHVPDFYLGRPLPSIHSLVNITALISTDIETRNLIYRWTVNDTVIDGGALRGKNKVSFLAPSGYNPFLSLQVTDLSGVVIAKKNMILPVVKPELHFYEVSTLFGLNQRPFNEDLLINSNSITLQAEPYYLDSRVYNEPRIKEWKISGQTSKTGGSNPYQVTLQKIDEGGAAVLEFHVRDTEQLLQGVQSNIKIKF